MLAVLWILLHVRADPEAECLAKRGVNLGSTFSFCGVGYRVVSPCIGIASLSASSTCSPTQSTPDVNDPSSGSIIDTSIIVAVSYLLVQRRALYCCGQVVDFLIEPFRDLIRCCTARSSRRTPIPDMVTPPMEALDCMSLGACCFRQATHVNKARTNH